MIKKTLSFSLFANGPGDLGSVPGRVIPKTLKIVLDTPLHNTQQNKYVSRVKWNKKGKGVTPSPTPWCIPNFTYLHMATALSLSS